MARWGIAHIFASFNNIIITVTDLTGAETIARCSGGMVTKSAKDEGSPYTAMKVAQTVAESVLEKGIDSVNVRIRGQGNKALTPGRGAQAGERSSHSRAPRGCWPSSRASQQLVCRLD